MTTHAHDWQPIQGWTGRYRCTGCGAVGYRSAEADLALGRPEDAVVPTWKDIQRERCPVRRRLMARQIGEAWARIARARIKRALEMRSP